MSNVFKNQGYFSLLLDTGINLNAATNPRIYYKKPNGVTGFFVATVQDTTKLSYQFTNNDLDISGVWQFQAYVEIGGLKAYGDFIEQTVRTPIA